MTTPPTTPTESFRSARDFLLEHREDYITAYEGFSWPRPEYFNWALDWFDVIAAGNDRTALHIVEEDGRETKLSFAELSGRSDRAAAWLRELGVRAGDRVLVMLGNQAELWETALAAMKLRAVVIPATPSWARPTCATVSSGVRSGMSSCAPRTRPSSTRCPATTHVSPSEPSEPSERWEPLGASGVNARAGGRTRTSGAVTSDPSCRTGRPGPTTR